MFRVQKAGVTEMVGSEMVLREVNSDRTIEEMLVELLRKKGYFITCAESCTGGLVCGRLVNVTGASDILSCSLITYADEAKVNILGVRKETIDKYGVVSEETAYEMAKGALEFAGADVALSVTGIAGPGGEEEGKPVGLVYMACNVRGNISVEKHIFSGDRKCVRESSVQAVLELAYRELKK